MLDLAETKGALTQGFSGANPRRTKFKKRGRARGRDSHLLKKVLYWNHIKSEKVQARSKNKHIGFPETMLTDWEVI